MKRILTVLIFLPIVGFLPYSFPVRPLDTTPFAFNLLHAVLQEDTGQRNQLVSPLSIYLSLCLLYNGAERGTRDSIDQVLQLQSTNIYSLNAGCKTLMQEIHLEDDRAQLSLGQSVWCNQARLTFLPSFEKIAENYYYTNTQSLNFNAAKTSTRINNWMSDNTGHKVSGVLSRNNPKDLIYLLNTAYFNGDWQFPFDVNDSYKDLFYLPDGQTKTIPYMKKEFVTGVFSDTSFTLFELPYGKGKAYNMYVLLPDDPQLPLREFAASLNEERLDRALLRKNDQFVQLSLPSWEYAGAITDMRPALSRLGLGSLFDGKTNFSGMVKTGAGGAAISKLLHHTYIKVSEDGTRISGMAAETAISPAGRRRFRPLVLKVDHPFLYLIMEKQRNLLLFAGIVNDPAAR